MTPRDVDPGNIESSATPAATAHVVEGRRLGYPQVGTLTPVEVAPIVEEPIHMFSPEMAHEIEEQEKHAAASKIQAKFREYKARKETKNNQETLSKKAEVEPSTACSHDAAGGGGGGGGKGPNSGAPPKRQ
ncbi:hypothetical protein BV898_10285 [Hypsibius exemplaris]|uniref:Uncharacterized protein n=1 Tax=Hypsibius exemplaris TaxID=2072580 RepID=A0A1W0WK66_HYPEX|nr:hypothetical protein BV898_10285 [Hypsibius exemplaris]